MTAVEYLPNPNAEAKAKAALKDLEQAWAYYTPEVLPAQESDQQAPGFVPYYDAA